MSDVIYTSQISNIHNDLATDDSTLINDALSTLSGTGGGIVYWDGRHAFMHALKIPSNIKIVAVDQTIRLKYFGANASGTDDHCIKNANPRKGLPSQTGTYTNKITLGGSFSASLPIKLLNQLNSGSGDLTITLKTNQGKLMPTTPFKLTLIRTADHLTEVVNVTNVTGDVLTITRPNTRRVFAANSKATITIIDENLWIENLTVDCNGTSIATTGDDETGIYYFGLMFLGVDTATIKNVTLLNCNGWAMVVGNTKGVVVIDTPVIKSRASVAAEREDWYQTYSGSDGLHCRGPWETIIIRNGTLNSSDNNLALDWGGWEAAGMLTAVEGTAGDGGVVIVEDTNMMNPGDFNILSLYGGDLSDGGVIILRRCILNNTGKSTDPSGSFIVNQNVATGEGGACRVQLLQFEDCILRWNYTVLPDEEALSFRSALIDTLVLDGVRAEKWDGEEKNLIGLETGGVIGNLVTKDLDWSSSGGEILGVVTGTITKATLLPMEVTNTLSEMPDAVWELASKIDGKTPQEALQIIAAIVAGKISGAGTGEETFKGMDGVTTRAIVTCDVAGNRSAVQHNP
jgi:hypothetical protein